jgi:hypothetical protein
MYSRSAFFNHAQPPTQSVVGGGLPLPTRTCTPGPVTPSTVKNTVAGPGGNTRPFGGTLKVSDARSLERLASIKTSRALEWNACDEKPRSISETSAE